MVSAPGDITIGPPTIPTVSVPAPSPNLVVVPVSGPQGPRGPAGDTGTALGYVHSQISSASLVQINHGLVFKPSAPVCVDTGGNIIDYDKLSWPSTGIMEVDFGTGVLFSGTIYVS
jgi:hypothetical protein